MHHLPTQLTKTGVPADKLIGYRKPSEWEKEHVQIYMIQDLRFKRRMMNVGAVFTGIVSFSLFVSLFEVIQDIKMFFLKIVLFSIFLSVFLGIMIRRRCNQAYKKANILSGDFSSLDCTIFDIYICTDHPSALVRIKTKEGQASMNKFTVDRSSANLAQKNPSLPFWLMKTNSGKEELYELFSQKSFEIAERFEKKYKKLEKGGTYNVSSK